MKRRHVPHPRRFGLLDNALVGRQPAPRGEAVVLDVVIAERGIERHRARRKHGYLWANEAPGWGIEVDEKAAARFPYGRETGERGQLN